MKTILPAFLFAAFFILTPVLLSAQNDKEYTLHLNSGKFIPAKNSGALIKSSPILTNSLFSNQYYVVIQFAGLPTNNEKASLKTGGIVLGDYLPNNAFIAIIGQNFNVDLLNSNNIRSVIQLSPDQKTVPQILKGNFPVHAIKSAGMVELTVTTYAKLSVAFLAATFKKLGVIVIEDMPMFRSFILRIPQQNVQQLIAQPFVQWVEPILPMFWKIFRAEASTG